MSRPHRTGDSLRFFTTRGAARGGRVRMRGFTLVELLVVIAVIGIVAAILFPVLARVREKARQTACLSNLNQIGLAISQYASDYDEALPPAHNGTTTADFATWRTVVYPYVKDRKIFACPSNPYHDIQGADDQNFMSYGANETLMTVPPVTLINPNQIEFPSLVYLIGESSSNSWKMHTPPNNPFTNPLCAVSAAPGVPTAGCEAPEAGSSTDLYAGHDGLGNWLFADGHAKALKPTSLCKGMDMWNLSNSNNGLPCSAALQASLAANENYWTATNQP